MLRNQANLLINCSLQGIYWELHFSKKAYLTAQVLKEKKAKFYWFNCLAIGVFFNSKGLTFGYYSWANTPLPCSFNLILFNFSIMSTANPTSPVTLSSFSKVTRNKRYHSKWKIWWSLVILLNQTDILVAQHSRLNPVKTQLSVHRKKS